jgi:hypothetical protein
MVFDSSQNKGKTVNVYDNYNKPTTYCSMTVQIQKIHAVHGWLWLPMLCNVLSSARDTDTSATGNDGIVPVSISILFWAVLPTQRTRFWPCSTTFFDVLCSGHVPAG